MQSCNLNETDEISYERVTLNNVITFCTRLHGLISYYRRQRPSYSSPGESDCSDLKMEAAGCSETQLSTTLHCVTPHQHNNLQSVPFKLASVFITCCPGTYAGHTVQAWRAGNCGLTAPPHSYFCVPLTM